MKIPASLGLAAVLLLSGCEKQPDPSPHGTLAILDLDAVAKRLGRDVAITGELKSENDALIEKLTKSRDELQEKFDSSKQSVGDKPTEEQAQQLAQLSQSMNSQLQSKQQEAREALNTKQVALVQKFREEVKPVAQKIAAKKGMHTVLLRSELTVLSSDPAVEITDDVVAEMIDSGKGTATISPTATP